MKKFFNVFLVALLSFQIVVPADGLGEYFDDFGNAVEEAAAAGGQAVKSAGYEVGDAVVDGAGNIIGYVADKAGTVIDKSGKVIGTVVKGAGKVVDAVGNVIGGLWDWITGDDDSGLTKSDATIVGNKKPKDDGDQNPQGDGKQDDVKPDDNKQNDPKQDDPKQDDPKGNDNKGNDKKKDDGPSAFDILTKLIKGVAALWAADKINDIIQVLNRYNKTICSAKSSSRI